jgi:ATP-dependent Zn protease
MPAPSLVSFTRHVSVMQSRDVIEEDDIFVALEKIHNEKFGGVPPGTITDDGAVTPLLRRTLATYMASKALLGIITPGFDELQKIVVTPGGTPTGYTYFIPHDAHLETDVLTLSFMEAHVVVCNHSSAPAQLVACGLLQW